MLDVEFKSLTRAERVSGNCSADQRRSVAGIAGPTKTLDVLQRQRSAGIAQLSASIDLQVAEDFVQHATRECSPASG